MNTVYRYGLLPPLDWGEDCTAQMRLANDLWNRLVEIEHAVREEVRRVTADDPEAARLQAAFDALAVRREAGDDDARAEMAPVAEALQVASRASRSRQKPRLTAIEEGRKRNAKTARQEANAAGLWWGNANQVAADYEAARECLSLKSVTLDGYRNRPPAPICLAISKEPECPNQNVPATPTSSPS